MAQIELKDLNPSLSAESFLEDLTDEGVNILGGTHEGGIDLVSAGFQTTLDRVKEYSTLIETTLDNLSSTDRSGANYSFFYTSSQCNPAHGCLVFYG
jgi:hypothetical protein